MADGALPADAQALLDAAPCGLMQTGDDGTFRRVNRTFCSWLGYEADELVGRRRFQDLLTMGGRIFHQTHWSPLLRMQGSLSEVKLEVRHVDGTPLPMVLNAIRRDEAGVMVHDLSAYVARDRDRYERELVTSRRRLEVLVAEANQLHAEAKDRALFAEQMIGIVSHDLRNPLSAVMMGSALLAGADLPPNQSRIVSRITRATERANKLIKDLLDFTQARVGRGIAILPAPVEGHETVAEAVEELRLAYPERSLVHHRAGDGRCTLDSDRLTQLIGNLISNAMTYGDRAVPVTVSSTGQREAFTVSVHNAGPSIAPEVQATMFQPMVRGTHAGSGVRSVGLGLFIVREIARAHGGDASVTSTPADGTTFTVVFPQPAR